MDTKNMEVNPQPCTSCPFRDDGWAHLRPMLMERAMTDGTPICHSTGSKALVSRTKRVSGRSKLCRGARDYQAEQLYRMGIIDAPTDEAWQAKREELGISSTTLSC